MKKFITALVVSVALAGFATPSSSESNACKELYRNAMESKSHGLSLDEAEDAFQDIMVEKYGIERASVGIARAGGVAQFMAFDYVYKNPTASRARFMTYCQRKILPEMFTMMSEDPY